MDCHIIVRRDSISIFNSLIFVHEACYHTCAILTILISLCSTPLTSIHDVLNTLYGHLFFSY